MNSVVLIRGDAVEELKKQLHGTHGVVINKPVVREGRVWYPGPIVVSTVPEDLPKVGWWTKMRRLLVSLGKSGFN